MTWFAVEVLLEFLFFFFFPTVIYDNPEVWIITLLIMVAQEGEEDPVYDIVFAVEKTANLVPYLEELKTNYLLPTLQ